MKHGRKTAPEYVPWVAMKQRCRDPKATGYEHYGGRGITVCDRWRENFAAFLADMGPRPSMMHSLDRINNDGNYEPGNVRWATMREQRNNSRQNHQLSFDGETHTVTEWARLKGVSIHMLRVRVRRGWTVERALTTHPTTRAPRAT